MSYDPMQFEPGIERKIKVSTAIFLVVIICFLYIRESIYGDEITKDILLNIERHTSVIDLYNNKEQHNAPYVKYSNGTNKILEFPYQIGDSISKNKGDSIEYIFRKQEVIRNNLLENYRNSN
ncbi:hypothetical protein [Chryseobacterium aquaticum]|uniref:hypothetical protein n=1 Tax=Chryseobacterium aquaticum TaxID=452084 RepID=UPI003F6E8999